MGRPRALDRVWVRACLLVPTALILFVGLFMATEVLVEDNHHVLGPLVGYVDWAILVVAIFFGPAWVIKALPTPPRNDGPPRGRVVSLSTRAPADTDVADTVADRRDRAARTSLGLDRLDHRVAT